MLQRQAGRETEKYIFNSLIMTKEERTYGRKLFERDKNLTGVCICPLGELLSLYIPGPVNSAVSSFKANTVFYLVSLLKPAAAGDNAAFDIAMQDIKSKIYCDAADIMARTSARSSSRNNRIPVMTVSDKRDLFSAMTAYFLYIRYSEQLLKKYNGSGLPGIKYLLDEAQHCKVVVTSRFDWYSNRKFIMMDTSEIWWDKRNTYPTLQRLNYAWQWRIYDMQTGIMIAASVFNDCIPGQDTSNIFMHRNITVRKRVCKIDFLAVPVRASNKTFSENDNILLKAEGKVMTYPKYYNLYKDRLQDIYISNRKSGYYEYHGYVNELYYNKINKRQISYMLHNDNDIDLAHKRFYETIREELDIGADMGAHTVYSGQYSNIMLEELMQDDRNIPAAQQGCGIYNAVTKWGCYFPLKIKSMLQLDYGI